MTDTIINNVCHTLIEHSVCATVVLARLSYSFNYNFNLNYAHCYSWEQICIMNEHLNELYFHINNSHMAILHFSKSNRVRVLFLCVISAYSVENMSHHNNYFVQLATPHQTIIFTYHIYYYSMIRSININKRPKEVPCCLFGMFPITDQQANLNVTVDSS